jgi:acetylornithine/N-succinyldiaminopimelate aminotransferase
MAIAKGIGSGFPMGACLATNSSSIGMTKGTHGSTFGGNPLAIAVGTVVINEIMNAGFLELVDKIARYLWKALLSLQKDFDEIVEVRGAGLLLGIKTKSNNVEISKLFEDHGLLTIPASDNIIRLSPPLIITKKDVDYAIQLIRRSLKSIK